MDYFGNLPNRCTNLGIIMENTIMMFLWIIALCIIFVLCDIFYIVHKVVAKRKATEKRITEQYFNYR